jgi:hypothetical protein
MESKVTKGRRVMRRPFYLVMYYFHQRINHTGQRKTSVLFLNSLVVTSYGENSNFLIV